MASSLTSKHIPTVVGIFVLIAGLVGGIFLANSATTGFLPRASAETTPKNTKVTNISDSSFTVSWVTDAKTAGYFKYGTSPTNLAFTSTDDRDQISGTTGSFQTHHVTIRGLSPQTTYYYKIGSASNILYDNNGQPYQTNTVSPVSSNAKTVYGQVLTSQQAGVPGAIIYLTADDMAPLSTFTQPSGSFVLSLAQARTKSLSSAAVLSDTLAVSVLAQGDSVNTTSVIQATLSQAQPLPEIILGVNQDLTITPTSTANPFPTAPPTDQEIQSKFTAQLLAPPTEIISTASAQTLTITSPVDTEIITVRKPKLTGDAPKSSKVLVEINGPTIVRSTLTATSLGKWTYNSSKSLEDGSYILTTTATSSGKTEKSSVGFTVSVPTATPKTLVTATDAALPVSGTQEFTIAIAIAGLLLIASGYAFSLAKIEQS